MLTDPGAIPKDIAFEEGLEICKKCKSPKPERAHHCSTCRRCILKMDHHCPWVNNCVGANNQKHFILFIFYVNIQCISAIIILSFRMVSCSNFHAMDADYRSHDGFLAPRNRTHINLDLELSRTAAHPSHPNLVENHDQGCDV